MLCVGVIGDTDRARAIAGVLAPGDVTTVRSFPDFDAYAEDEWEADLLAVATGSASSRYVAAEQAIRSAHHVFIDAPTIFAVEQATELAHLAEEAGVEVVLSRPDRLHPVIRRLIDESTPSLITLNWLLPNRDELQRSVVHAIDICCAVMNGSPVHRDEVQSITDNTGEQTAIAVVLRFHSGALAIAHLGVTPNVRRRELFAGGAGWSIQSDLDEAAINAPCAMVDVLVNGGVMRGSIHDLITSIRITGRIVSRLESTDSST